MKKIENKDKRITCNECNISDLRIYTSDNDQDCNKDCNKVDYTCFLNLYFDTPTSDSKRLAMFDLLEVLLDIRDSILGISLNLCILSPSLSSEFIGLSLSLTS